MLIFNVSLVKYLLYGLLDEPEQQATMLTNPSIHFLHLLVSTLGLQDSDKSIERKKQRTWIRWYDVKGVRSVCVCVQEGALKQVSCIFNTMVRITGT